MDPSERIPSPSNVSVITYLCGRNDNGGESQENKESHELSNTAICLTDSPLYDHWQTSSPQDVLSETATCMTNSPLYDQARSPQDVQVEESESQSQDYELPADGENKNTDVENTQYESVKIGGE